MIANLYLSRPGPEVSTLFTVFKPSQRPNQVDTPNAKCHGVKNSGSE